MLEKTSGMPTTSPSTELLLSDEKLGVFSARYAASPTKEKKEVLAQEYGLSLSATYNLARKAARRGL